MRSVNPKIGILFMSGYAEPSNRLRAQLPEGSELLDKPFRRIDLARGVRAALDR